MIPEFPLFVFTLLGGAAAGAYAFSAVFPQKQDNAKKDVAFPLVCLVLLAVSGLCLLMHLGHPERMFNAFSNFGAGITQEGFAMVGLGVMVVVDLAFCAVKGASPRWVRIAGAAFGVLLLAAMANAYSQLHNVPAAATFAVVPFFFVGGLALGDALFALFADKPYAKGAYLWASIAVVALLAVTLAVMGAHFASIGLSAVPFIAGLVIAPVAGVMVMLASMKADKAWAAPCVCALVLVGIAIARYAFYAVA